MFDEVIAALCSGGDRATLHFPSANVLQIRSFILRDAAKRPLLRMRSSSPHGEERGNAARLEPCDPLNA
jgi:hypothetical protein